MSDTVNKRVIRSIKSGAFWTGRKWGSEWEAALFKTDEAAIAVAKELGSDIQVYADYDTLDERLVYEK